MTSNFESLSKGKEVDFNFSIASSSIAEDLATTLVGSFGPVENVIHYVLMDKRHIASRKTQAMILNEEN